MTAAKSASSSSGNCIDLIDENDTWGILLRILEQIPDTGRSHTDKHLYEVRSRNRKKRNPGLSGNCFCKKGLTGSRRSLQKHSFWNSCSHLNIFLRRFQEIDNLCKLFFFFLQPRNICKCHFLIILRTHTGTTFSKIHCFCIGTATLSVHHHRNKHESDKHQHNRENRRTQHRILRDRAYAVFHIIFIQQLLRLIDIRYVDTSRFPAVAQCQCDHSGRHCLILVDHHLCHVVILYLLFKLSKRYLLPAHLYTARHP